MNELLHFPGSEQTIEIVLDAAATGGELALMTLRMPAGAGAPPHRHAQESETLVVREGVVCTARPDAPPPDAADVAAALERHGLDFSGT